MISYIAIIFLGKCQALVTSAAGQDIEVGKITESLQSLSFGRAINGILLDMLAITLVLCAVILLHRTASATLHSRFLRHLEYAFGTMVLFRAGKIVAAVLRSLLAYQYLGPWGSTQALAPQDAVAAAATLTAIDHTWQAAALMISFMSTFWLFLAWWLLAHYPSEGIPREYYASVTAVFSILSAVAVGVSGLTEANGLWLLEMLDIVTSSVALLLVGIELRKLEPRRGHPALSSVVFLFYISWAVLQPGPLLVMKHVISDQPFYTVLMFVGFGSMLTTAILASLVLYDRPEFRVQTSQAQGS